MRPVFATLLVLLLSVGCANSTTSSPDPAAPSPGFDAPNSASGGTSSLTIALKDSPFSVAKALLVTFSELSVHSSGSAGWVTVPFVGGASSRTCDLKKLETAQDILGVGALPRSHYTQLRLVVSRATIYFDSASAGAACEAVIPAPAGLNAPVEIPSGELKLNREFELAAAGVTTILLDFDGDQSVRLMGGGSSGGRYMMTPVVGIVSVQ